ncbi:hypothetical protein ES703_16993 [subsurface metagenome]
MIQKSTHAVPRADLGVAFHEYSPRRARYIAREILPILNVGKEAATISVTKRKNLTIPDTKHANGAVFNRVELYMDDMAYACEDHGLEGQVTDRDKEKYADDFDAEVEKTQGVKIKMMLAREKRIKDMIFNTTTWTGGDLYTDNSTNPWDTVTTDIIAQIVAAKEKVRLNTGVPANALIIGEAAMQNLLKNDDIIARFVAVTVITEVILRSAMSAIFGLQDLIVGQAAYNSADEGQDASMSDMWGDDYAMVAALGEEGLPMTEPQLGRTILWQNYIPDIEYVETYREEQTKSDIVRVEHSVDEKLFDAYFGHLMKIDA